MLVFHWTVNMRRGSGTREDNLCTLAYVTAGLSFNLCKWPHNAAFEPHGHVRHPADGLLTAAGVY